VLTREQLDHFRALLLQERAAIEARTEARAERIRATVPDADDPVDEADQGTLARERDQLMIEEDLDRDTLERIDRAQARLDEGTYGTSEVSGKPIPIERLEVVPWATTLTDERDPETI
jgi:RNA polymerase-binding transcription factor